MPTGSGSNKYPKETFIKQSCNTYNLITAGPILMVFVSLLHSSPLRVTKTIEMSETEINFEVF